MIFRARTGIQWRDLPERFGKWRSVYNRFRNCALKDVWAKGRPLHVTLTPGERHEMIAARELIDFARGPAVVGDTGYDSNEFRAS